MLRNSEFNYLRNDAGECVLIPGLSPRDPDPKGQCRADDAWYELTPYRKIPYSSCEGGKRLDRGAKHTCPGVGGHSAFFWLMMLFIPVSFAGLIGYYYHKKGGYGRGYVSATTCGAFRCVLTSLVLQSDPTAGGRERAAVHGELGGAGHARERAVVRRGLSCPL